MNQNINLEKRTAVKLIGGAVLALCIAAPAVAAPADDHWDQFSCYAYVHDQCYANGQNNCSDDDYDWGLDQCDETYPAAQIKRPGGLKALAVKKSSRRTMMSIRKSFR